MGQNNKIRSGHTNPGADHTRHCLTYMIKRDILPHDHKSLAH